MTHFIKAPKHLHYYTRLNKPYVIEKLRYHFHGKTIVYGIRCRVTNMFYIGSTFTPRQRFRNHLVTSHDSNSALQQAIAMHGLECFTVYVFEIVQFSSTLSYDARRIALRSIEQRYINMFPADQLYNSILAQKG